MKYFDFSPELLIYRYQSGLKLVRPDEVSHCSLGHDTGYTISSLLQLPFNIGICDLNHQIQYVNTAGAYSLGLVSEKAMLGQSISHVYSSNDVMQNRQAILATNKTQITEEELTLHHNSKKIQRLSVRSPWYNNENKIVGLINTSITLGEHSLSHALTHIANLTLAKLPTFQAKSFTSTPKNIFLTPREKQIGYYLIRGKTAKLISALLNISSRTVEVHLEHMKQKLEAYSKSVLIERLLDGFSDELYP